jgi:uncharacterized membrane protein YeaQ/YmgE (transglycosylase-associated protein family)
MMYQFLHAIGWRYMSTGDILFIAAMAGSVFLIMAWLTDILMERLSFGVIMNTLLMAFGAALGLMALVWLDMAPTRRDYLPAIFACGLSAILTLMLLAAFKRAV